jgi:tetratricopeptide (TPR) repeat protein
MDRSRVEFLQEALEANPDDTFARYALAVELSTCDKPAEAWRHFEYLLNRHPDYSATYFQAGKFLVQQDRRHEARRVFAKGIEVAQRQGNHHAQSELQAALESLSIE